MDSMCDIQVVTITSVVPKGGSCPKGGGFQGTSFKGHNRVDCDHGHLGLSKLVSGCCGVMFVKIRVQKPEISPRKSVSHESAIP